MRRGWRVVVLTSQRGYENPAVTYARAETRNGVSVKRLPFSSFGKASIRARLLGQTLFLAQALIRGLWTRDLEALLVSTSPPFAGFGGALLAWIRRVPMTWWVMDLNPDQMIVAGKIRSTSLAARTFDWMNRVTLSCASHVIALDAFMRKRLLAKRAVADKLSVIPPWPHDDRTQVRPLLPNAFRDAQGYGDSFIIMYSGNHAIQHPLDTLLAAAQALEGDPTLLFVFVGGGAGKAEIDTRIANGAKNLRSLPYQPLERLGDSLAAANVHVVSMGDDMVGIVHPCKIYGAMAVGRPILYFGPTNSHIGDILTHHAIGWMVSHGDISGAIAAIKDARSSKESERISMGQTAANEVSRLFSRNRLLHQMCDLIEMGAKQ